jgi:hypothetical protein
MNLILLNMIFLISQTYSILFVWIHSSSFWLKLRCIVNILISLGSVKIILSLYVIGLNSKRLLSFIFNFWCLVYVSIAFNRRLIMNDSFVASFLRVVFCEDVINLVYFALFHGGFHLIWFTFASYFDHCLELHSRVLVIEFQYSGVSLFIDCVVVLLNVL